MLDAVSEGLVPSSVSVTHRHVTVGQSSAPNSAGHTGGAEREGSWRRQCTPGGTGDEKNQELQVRRER